MAGIVMVLVGGVGAFIAKGQAERDAFVDELGASLQGQLIDVTPDYTLMWVLIVIAVLGAVALIMRVAAARPTA